MPLTATLLLLASLAQPGWTAPPDTDWRHYAADGASTKYAPLDQINGANFGQLEIAWRYQPPDAELAHEHWLRPDKNRGSPITYMDDGPQYVVVPIGGKYTGPELVGLALKKE